MSLHPREEPGKPIWLRSSRHQSSQITSVLHIRNDRRVGAPLLPRYRSNSDTNQDHDLPTKLHPQLAIQVRDGRVQTCVNPSQLKPKAQCRLWNGRVRTNSIPLVDRWLNQSYHPKTLPQVPGRSTSQFIWIFIWIVLKEYSSTLVKMDYDILYKSDIVVRLEGYTDAEWASYKADRRLASGFVFSLGN